MPEVCVPMRMSIEAFLGEAADYCNSDENTWKNGHFQFIKKICFFVNTAEF